MRRANFWWNLIPGIGLATFGVVSLCQFLSGHNDWPVGFLFYLYLLSLAFLRINTVTQSLEVTETEIIYQTAWKITRVQWHEVNAYVLTDTNFIAVDKQQGKILLDLDLRSDGKIHWPVAKCAQFKTFIERKMTEVGASKESRGSLYYHHAVKIKP